MCRVSLNLNVKISISNVGTCKFKDQMLDHSIKVIPAGYDHRGISKTWIYNRMDIS